MKETILETLRTIEQQHNIKILYAVESGSRAWGFASPDSDYDVRYIYVRTVEDYLRVNSQKDTIEGPLDDVLDFSGWDIRKMLELLRRTNPSLMEWAQSPIVYLTTPEWEALAKAIPEFFDPRSNMHHYLSMILSNWNKHMQDDLVKLKRYLYVLRPLLCCRWLERFGTVPPVLFDKLREAVLPPEMESVVDDLLQRKMAAEEAEKVPHIPELDSFIRQEIPRLKQLRDEMPHRDTFGYEQVNELFRQVLRQVWQREL